MTKDEIIREEIIIQAQKLFKQFGLKKTTMDEIATACGKAKSTLYHYFKSKEEVFTAVLDKELKNLRAIVKDKVDSQKRLVNKMICYITSFHEAALNKINLYRAIKEELVDTPSSRVYFKKMMDFEIKYLIRILEDAYDSGEHVDHDREEIPWYAEIMIAAFMGIVRYSVETDEGIDNKKLTKTAEELIPKLFG